MKRSLFVSSLLALPIAWASTSFAGEPEPAKAGATAEVSASASASASFKLEVNDSVALEEDILLVLALPLQASEARDNGVPAEEVADAVDAVEDAGMPVAEATLVLEAESARAKKSGAPKHFGAWVRLQVAKGLRGKELADAIKKKKAEYRELTAEEKAEVEKGLAELHAKWQEHRKAVWTLRAELVGKGKKAKLVAAATHKKLLKAQLKNAKRQERLEKALADHPEHKDALEKLLGKVEKAEEKLEKAEEKAEDKAEKAEDKAEKKADKAEKKADEAEKKADKAEKKADEAEKKADKAEKKADEAKKKAEDAKKKAEGKAEGKAG